MGESKSSQMLLFSLTGRHDPAHWFMAGLLCETIVRLQRVYVCECVCVCVCINSRSIVLVCGRLLLLVCVCSCSNVALCAHVCIRAVASREEGACWSTWPDEFRRDQATEGSRELILLTSFHPRLGQLSHTNRSRLAEADFILWLHDWTSATGSMLRPERSKQLSRGT